MEIKNPYYVRAIKAKGAVTGYGVYDAVNCMESEHIRFVEPHYSPLISLELANQWRDDANAKVA